ncbi:hypothetical protein GT037_008653 [Alternaria burnsii]|uniref:Uncharacterized protein n=1 Tax=Alternaria burnsii TaxID=1187904 RepID=A0A8H7B121_9PLEO|nr:uncharacterized protein GT037_008653 [Alternaria burnsii]KAF7673330.1 hypothetical protein GT037_008653 [Alternaria burnsii]
MVFIPVGVHDPLRAAFSNGWDNWRDGAPVGPAPHTLEPTAHACEILEDFKSRDGHKIHYKKGMQGCYLAEHNMTDGTRIAQIFIHGVTEWGPGPGERKAWVPYDKIKIGPEWNTNLKDWAITVDALSGLGAVRWRTPPSVGSDIVAQSVTMLIQAFIDTPADFMCGAFESLVADYTVAGLSQIILGGMKDAGVYETMFKANYTSMELLGTARYQINASKGYNKTGVYMRMQTSTANAKYWKRNTKYAYVGKTEEDFRSRFLSHPRGTNKYSILNQNSTTLTSFALCVLSKKHPTKLFYLAEQVLLCLLGTYRSEILNAVSYMNQTTIEDQSSQFLSDIAAASYCLKVSSKVFQQTGYVPALMRPTFGISEGANTRSPIDEMESRLDKMLFIRTDHVLQDYHTRKPIEVAEFRRHVPRVANYIDHLFVKGGRSIFAVLKVPPKFESDNKKQKRLIHAVHVSAPIGSTDGINYPKPGAGVQVVVEARLDGKAHKNSWARLPQVGIFKNWDQANSFAVRIEWETEEGSGVWRYRYIQCTKYLHTMADSGVPGSVLRYAKGIAIVHWLFGVQPSWNESWIKKPGGRMRVLQAEYNLMTQSVRFIRPTKPYNVLSFARNSSHNIAMQMDRFNVAGRREDCKSQRARQHCDLCLFLTSMIGNSVSKICTKEGKDKRICTECREWGLPFCSWTSWLRSYIAMQGRNGPDPTEEDWVLYRRVEAALYASPPADTTGLTIEQDLVSLQDAAADDGSDDEDMDDLEIAEDDVME